MTVHANEAHPAVGLWRAHRAVAPYPVGVKQVPEPIEGNAFFPGGLGLWKNQPSDPIPQWPRHGVMVLGHDFHSEEGYHASLVRGEESLRSLTLVEGWTFRQLRGALAKAPDLRQDTAELSDADIMERLGRMGQHPEGRFFPDTYSYAKGSSDLKLLALALRTMDRHLQAAWENRAPDSPLRTPQEALILASIIEKETGIHADRALIAGVFNNRLRLGMMLQTDPTVIYGMGELFDGNLRKKDLQTDTPWNTYTRAGLPPTPIAMPGRESLLAAVAPASTKALYFVARGDGSSAFSNSLDEHNRAVNQYQRKR